MYTVRTSTQCMPGVAIDPFKGERKLRNKFVIVYSRNLHDMHCGGCRPRCGKMSWCAVPQIIDIRAGKVGMLYHRS